MDMQAESPWACDHEQVRVRKRVQSNGVTVAVRQCLRCGRSRGNVPKAGVVLASLETWDEALAESFRASASEQQSRAWEERQEQYRREKEEEDERWWQWYDGYLRTPQWRALRAKVFRRSGGLCEGCGERYAVQVHHLTYARVGREMLFDLAAVCEECHRSIHEDRPLPRKG